MVQAMMVGVGPGGQLVTRSCKLITAFPAPSAALQHSHSLIFSLPFLDLSLLFPLTFLILVLSFSTAFPWRSTALVPTFHRPLAAFPTALLVCVTALVTALF